MNRPRAQTIIVSTASAFVLLAAGTTAGAAIAGGPIDNSGVIHGCWTNTAVNGSHVFVLQDAGTTCPKGTTAISWNQQGPQGLAGPTGPAFSLAVSAALPAGSMTSAQAAARRLRVITTFKRGAVPESLAVDRKGNLYVSLAYFGDVVRVTPCGHHHTLAHLDVGDAGGFLTGLAFDSAGNLYVADATFETSPTPPGVFRIDTHGVVTRVATLPAYSFPNGLAFHDGTLYISDSSRSVIWRLLPGGKVAIWLRNPLLAPKTKTGIGANDLAFRRGSFYTDNSDFGTIVRMPFRAGSRPGVPVVIAHAKSLKTGDGLAFDVKGNLYIAVNDNRLMRLAPDGTLTQLAAKRDGLSFTTQPAFGTTRTTRTTLYLTNGAVSSGTPDIVALDVGVRGLRLPQ